MSAVPVDLTISSRWIVPMVVPGVVLENHTLVVRDGRILDITPTALAVGRYAALAHIDRSAHVLLPGLVDAYAPLTRDLDSPSGRSHDHALLRVAAMLSAGTTTFCSVGKHPDQDARLAMEQGMRAVIGIPVGEVTNSDSGRPDDSLTRALAFRDEYRGHPNISTIFAPQSVGDLSDAVLSRVTTLADELDAGILCVLHESAHAVARCIERHGMRPLQRLHALGLLTPALTAVSMCHVDERDIELARRSGLALALCPAADAFTGNPPAPVAVWAATGLRCAMASGTGGGNLDLWSAARLLATLNALPTARDPHQLAWEVLAAATSGGAAVLGWESEVGSLESGKWADICCVDLQSPGMHAAALAAPSDVAMQLVYQGGRDGVSDVWVAGRHLLNAREFTRLDWPALCARTPMGRSISLTGDSP